MLLRRIMLLSLLLGVLSNAKAEAQWRKTFIKAEYQSQYEEAAPVGAGDGVRTAALRVAHDSWMGEDKVVDHFFGSFAVAYISASLTHASSSQAQARVFYWCAGFWTANEVKDAFLPWEKVGWIGGDGFSYKDLVWSLAGTGLGLIIHP
jgi:uncharacterized protein YfiM (DUF2279 family)